MARILNLEAYPFAETISDLSYLVGTDATDNKETKNFKIEDLKTHILPDPLTPGTFENATVVVDSDGQISSVTQGASGSSKWSFSPNSSDIYRNSNVGIGDFSAADPAEALEVQGKIQVSGADAEFVGDIRGAIRFKAQAGEQLSKGDAVYISGISGNTPIVEKADSSDAAKMPAFGLAYADTLANGPVEVLTFGTLSNIDTSSYSLGDVLYVSTTAGQLTNTPPAGEANLLQNIGKVERVQASSGSIKVGGAGRTNATPNLNQGSLFIGDASSQSSTLAIGGANTFLKSDGTTAAWSNINNSDVTGSVQISPTPANNEVAVWTNGTTLEGDSNFTWNGVTLEVANADHYSRVHPDYFLQLNESADANLLLYTKSAGTSVGSEIVFGRWNGTVGSESPLINGQLISAQRMSGSYDTALPTNITTGALIEVRAAENWTTTDQGVRYSIDTNALGETSPTERFAIESDGSTTIKGGLEVISTKSRGIDLTHSPSNTGTAIGYNLDLVGNANTGTAYGFYSKVNTLSGGNAYGAWFRVLGSDGAAFGSYNTVQGGVGGASYGAYNLVSIEGTNTSGGTMYGSQNVVGISTSGTHGGSIVGSSVDINYNKVGGTLTNAYGFYSTGIVCDDSGATVQNAYGVYLGDNAGDGTIIDSYGVYQVGTDDKNYFGGQLQLNHTSGIAGQFLKAVDAAGNAEWADVPSGVTATSGAATQIAVFDGTDSIVGDSDLTFGSGILKLERNGLVDLQISSAGTSEPRMDFIQSRGTLTSPTATANGDTLGITNYFGYNGTVEKNAGVIELRASENWSDVVGSQTNGSLMSFRTVTNGSTSLTEKYLIDGDGNHTFTGKLGIGTAPDSTKGLNLSTTGAFGGFFENTGANSSNYGVYGRATGAGSSGNFGGYFISNSNQSQNIGLAVEAGSGGVISFNNEVGVAIGVKGSVSGGRDAYGTLSNIILDSSWSGGVVEGHKTEITSNVPGTVGTMRGASYILDATSGFILDMMGIDIDLTNSGATGQNAYGIKIQGIAGTWGGDKYAIYQTGANDKNYFAGSIQSDSQIYSTIQSTTVAATSSTIDWNDGNVAVLELGGSTSDVTLTLTNPKAGASYLIKIVQGASLVDVIFPSTVKFAGETAPYTLDVTATDNAIDVVALTCISDSGTVEYLANVSQNYG
jgi:hypothetical protein